MICHSEFDTRSAQHLNPMQGLLRLDQSQEMKDSVEYTDLLACRNDQERFAVHFPLLNQIPFVSDLPQPPLKIEGCDPISTLRCADQHAPASRYRIPNGR